jgi:tRNA G18 (ribose-2'-O)-methylase SpoU
MKARSAAALASAALILCTARNDFVNGVNIRMAGGASPSVN